MKYRRNRLALSVILASTLPAAAAEPLAFTVHADRPVKTIDVRIYGQFLEHIFNSVHGGLWGDQILNGTLELDPARGNAQPDPHHAPRGWEFVGDNQSVFADAQNPLNAAWSVALHRSEDATAPAPSLVQHHLALKANEHYTFTLYARGTATLSVSFTGTDKQGLITKEIAGLHDNWQPFTVDFTSPQQVDDATFAISLATAGDVHVDELSLFSAATLENHKLRPDLYKAVADLQPATIRWPGGGYANHYLWQSGIGPAEKRLPLPSVEWGDRDPNEFGSDEFLQMCERLHAEPILVLNITQPLEESLHWLHYCTDDVTTEWGQRRAQNGHPAPYLLRTIEIGNEAWLMMDYAKYLGIVKTFAPAIRKEFPKLELSVCGSYAYDTGPGEGVPGNANWDARLLHDAGGLFDVLSPHYYNGLLKENPADYQDDPRQYEQFLRTRAELIAKSPNPHIKIYVSEWNLTHGAWGNDWRTGLYAGGILNGFERQADTVQLSCPALFLRKIGTTRSWNNALINFDPAAWFPAGNYVVMKLWREAYAPNLLALDGPEKPLNIVATESDDHGTLFVKVVNPTNTATEAAFTLDGFAPASATMQVVAPGSEKAQNTIADPHAIQAVEQPVKLESTSVRVSFPALSAAVIKISK